MARSSHITCCVQNPGRLCKGKSFGPPEGGSCFQRHWETCRRRHVQRAATEALRVWRTCHVIEGTGLTLNNSPDAKLQGAGPGLCLVQQCMLRSGYFEQCVETARKLGRTRTEELLPVPVLCGKMLRMHYDAVNIDPAVQNNLCCSLTLAT